MENRTLYGFKFKGIIQNENKDECNIEVTSNDKEFLEYFRRIIDTEFRKYNISIMKKGEQNND